jgi:urea transport system ATP-binding protein
MLRVEGLDVAYRRSQVLFGVSLEVPDGGLLCVMGRNGVGKTTLLHAVMGVLKAARGRVLFDGEDITGLKPHERVRRGLAYVPQGHPVFPHLTVAENLSVADEARVTPAPSAVDDALDLFPRLRPLLGRRAGFLSGGQAQQLAFARALVVKPRLLLLDEPTEGIQPSIIIEIEDAIAQLHASTGLGIVLVEQYVEFALRLAERFAVMEGGSIVHAGEADAADVALFSDLLTV